MEVFSVFTTLSLVDMISGPLDRVRNAMRGVEGGVASLGRCMGNLALAMAPVALAAGVMLGVFGMAASKAMAFESAMADVAKVVNFESQAEFQGMSDTIRDMAGRIPMAADGIAAIIAAAGQSGVAKEDLAEFAEQAAKMGVAFDLTGDQAGKMMADWRAGMSLTLPQVYSLADAVNYLSNNMNATAPALGEVIQRVGAAAMACGLAETQVAALGAAFLSAGASPEVAATALKKFTTTLVKGTAMSKDQAAAFTSLGFSATQMAKDMQTDAQGTITKVLQALADKPKELQMSLLTEMFGEEAIGAIAPLLQNMDNLSQAFDLVGNKANYAGSMQAEFDTRSKTVANTLQLLSNKLTNLAISVGNAFLPSIGWAAEKLGVLVDAVRAVADTTLGQWVLQVAGALGTALVALTGLSAAIWFFTSVGPLLSKALAPAKAAILGLGAPVLTVIAVLGLLYAAYRTNFGGMADYIHECWQKITLTVKGVLAVFQTLKNGSGEIRGELATQIKAAGLVGLVTTVSRIVYRIQAVFKGFSKALGSTFDRIDVIFVPVRLAVAELMQTLSGLFGMFSGDEVTSAASSWEAFGAVLGEIAGGVLEGLATAFVWLVDGVRPFASIIGYAVDWVSALCSGLFTLTGATAAANDSADPTSWAALGKMLGVVLMTAIGIKAAFLAYHGVMLVVSVATKAWAAAQWLLNAAMNANPIGLVIALVVALAAAAGWAGEKWDAIVGFIVGAWDSIVSGIAGFGASLLSGLQGAWDAVKNGISAAWDGYLSLLAMFWGGILSGILNFGASLVGGLQNAWDAVSGAAGAAWDGITGLVSGAWDAIVGGLASFGASLLAGVTAAWNSVLEFFGGLNLFESGAKLLDTFIEGIKSKVSALVDSVSGALGKVREYLPFSDAHVGPLSQLTLSGARMMSTLAEGVTSGQGGLVSRVSGALSSVGGKIRDWWAGLGKPMRDTVSAVPVTSVTAVPQPVLPKMPRLAMEVPKLPAIADVEAPETFIPPAPAFDLQDDGRADGRDRTGSCQGGQTISIYGDIILPNVQNAQDFAESLRQSLQGEISMMEGMA